MRDYYDQIAKGYDELYGDEQKKKYSIIVREGVIKKEFSVLDVGCGSGVITNLIDAKRVVGVDPSKGLLKIAKKNKSHKYYVGCAEKLLFKNEEFDLVLSMTAIQNFTDIKKGLEEISRVGKKGFVLTFLKKSEKKQKILKTIKELFVVNKIVEEDKDIIVFATKKA